MDNQSSTPPESGGTEESRVESLDARFGAIEAEQERQGGILEEIRGALSGRRSSGTSSSAGSSSGQAPGGADSPAQAPADMAEQMRQAVRDVRAEEAAAAAQAQGSKAPEPETSPREVMVKGKQRLQKIMFGGEK